MEKSFGDNQKFDGFEQHEFHLSLGKISSARENNQERPLSLSFVVISHLVSQFRNLKVSDFPKNKKFCKLLILFQFKMNPDDSPKIEHRSNANDHSYRIRIPHIYTTKD